MNNSKWMLSLLVASFLLLPSAYAQDEAAPSMDKSKFSGERHEKMEKKIKEMFDQLNLTEEQQKKLEENKAANKEKRKAAFEQMKTAKESLHQELMKPELDMAAIDKIQSQLKAAQSQMIDDRLNSILEVRKILTPEQFGKFQSLMEQHRKEWRSQKESKDQQPSEND